MPVTLLMTIGLTIVILAVAAGLTARSHRARPAVMGVGLALIPVGLYLTGVTQLAADGVQALIDWLMRTPWTTTTSWGLGLFLGGILLIVVAAFLPKSRSVAVPATQAPTPSASGRPQVAQPSTRPVPAKPAAKGVDPEDAEIEALLRKRGIM